MNVLAANIPSLMQQKYVRIGQLFVPPNQVTATLGRYAHTLVCKNDHEKFPYTFRGSSMAFCLNGRYFSVFCQHQIKDYSPDQVILFPVASNGAKYIGGGVFHSILDASMDNEEFSDVCAIEFKPDKYTIENLKSEFFQVVRDECWSSNSLGNLIVYGYPAAFQDLRISEVETESELTEINFKAVVVSGRHVRASHARWVHAAEMLRTNSFPADGMSGGPVFHLGRDASGFFVGLAGMVQRGSPASDNFHFIDMGFLRKFAGA